jgi:hypothetical protein
MQLKNFNLLNLCKLNLKREKRITVFYWTCYDLRSNIFNALRPFFALNDNPRFAILLKEQFILNLIKL